MRVQSGWNHYIWRDGPVQAYLALAPKDDLATFKATDGKWFKIASITAAHGTTPNSDWWISYQKTSVRTSFYYNCLSFYFHSSCTLAHWA